MKRCLLIIIIIKWFTPGIYGLNLKTELLTKDHNLSNNEVTAVLKDKKGFIWIGTRDGLNRYDGRNIVRFRSDPSVKNRIPGNNIETLYEDSEGNIWIGFKSSGFCKFIPGKNEFISYNYIIKRNRLNSYRVISFFEDSDSTLWVGTWKGGAFRFKPDEADYKVKRYNINDIVRQITETSGKKIWLATFNGLLVVDIVSGKVTELDFRMHELNNVVTSLYYDKKKSKLWFGVWGKGTLGCIDNPEESDSHQNVKFYYDDKRARDKQSIYSMDMDRNGKLWLGSWGNGLSVFDTNTESYIYSKSHNNYSVKSSVILSIYNDNEGITWIGTGGEGVYKCISEPKGFKSLIPGKNRSSFIHSIYVDDSGKIYIGSQSSELMIAEKSGEGYIIKNQTNYRRLKKLSGITNIMHIQKDRYDNIYLGSGTDGFYAIDIRKSEVKSFHDNIGERSIPGRKVSSLFEDSSNNLWIGTKQNGVSMAKRSSKGEITDIVNFDSEDGVNKLNTARITSFIENTDGSIWIGSYSGIFIYSPAEDSFKTLIHKTDSNSVSSNIVHTIQKGDDGVIWVGTSNGLNKVEVKEGRYKFNYLGNKHGLPNCAVYGILADDNENIWMSTSEGLFRYSEKSKRSVQYNKKDGLLNHQFNEGAYFKDKNGTMYFGGTNGITYFDPKTIVENKFVPQISVTGFKMMYEPVKVNKHYDGKVIIDKTIENTDKIELSYRQNIFSFEFSSSSYMIPENNKFMYKLEGFDDSWHNLGTDNFSAFTGLKHGKYKLLVKGSNNDNVWCDTPASLDIVIKPPVWLTYWALMFYIILLLFMFYLYRRYYMMRINEENKLSMALYEKKKDRELYDIKLRFFTDLSHDVRTPLSLIISPVNELIEELNRKHHITAKLRIIKKNANYLHELFDNLLEFRKIETDNLKVDKQKTEIISFIADKLEFFEYELKLRSIKLKFEHPDIAIYADIDKSKIGSVLFNIVNNSIKYTPEGGFISVDVKSDFGDTEKVVISVTDSGKGIEKEKLNSIFDRFYQAESFQKSGSGIGLNISKKFVELHNGEIYVESEYGKGARFTFTLPVLDFVENVSSGALVDDQEYNNYKHSENSYDTKEISGDFSGFNKLVIVEDNEEFRNYLKSKLSKFFNISEASNGADGWEKIVEEKPDLVITDVKMPVMSGMELCVKVKSFIYTSHIPVVMLTSQADVAHEVEGLRSGADSYCIKPFDINVLIERIRNLISQRKKLQIAYRKDIHLKPVDIVISDPDENFLKKAHDIVEKNINNTDFNVDMFTREMGMGRSMFFEKIKSILNQTPNEFIKTVRLKTAAQLLLRENNRLSISEIAYETGFNTPRYFSKLFKEHFGCTPKDYISNISDK